MKKKFFLFFGVFLIGCLGGLTDVAASCGYELCQTTPNTAWQVYGTIYGTSTFIYDADNYASTSNYNGYAAYWYNPAYGQYRSQGSSSGGQPPICGESFNIAEWFTGTDKTGSWLFEFFFDGTTCGENLDGVYNSNLPTEYFFVEWDGEVLTTESGQIACSEYTTAYGCLYEGPNLYPTGRCSWDYASSTCSDATSSTYSGVATGTWASYYASNTDDKFPTSTEIFNSVADLIDLIITPFNGFISNYNAFFSATTAAAAGDTFGSAIPFLRGYLTPLNEFFSGWPISEYFILFLVFILVFILFKILYRIFKMIRG